MESHKKRQVHPILINEADQGEGPGGSGTPSLVLKSLLRPLSPPPLSEGLDQPLLINSCKNYRVDRTQLNLYFTVVSLRDTKEIRFTFLKIEIIGQNSPEVKSSLRRS